MTRNELDALLDELLLAADIDYERIPRREIPSAERECAKVRERVVAMIMDALERGSK